MEIQYYFIPVEFHSGTFYDIIQMYRKPSGPIILPLDKTGSAIHMWCGVPYDN